MSGPNQEHQDDGAVTQSDSSSLQQCGRVLTPFRAVQLLAAGLPWMMRHSVEQYHRALLALSSSFDRLEAQQRQRLGFTVLGALQGALTGFGQVGDVNFAACCPAVLTTASVLTGILKGEAVPCICAR